MKKSITFARFALPVLLLVGVLSFNISPALAVVGDEPTTQAADNITSSDATLHGTNGASNADGSSFWVSTNPSFAITGTDPSLDGAFSTPDLGAVTAGASFSDSLSDVAGILPITPNTTYYFVAWTEVGGLWSHGAILSLTTSLLSQTITFNALSGATYGDAPFTVSATGGASGNPVTFSTSSSASVCTVAGTTVTVVGVGTCSVTADQAGDGTYSAASSVTQSFVIAPKAITVTAQTNTKVYDGTTSSAAIPTLTSGALVVGDTATYSETYDTKDPSGAGKTLTPAAVIKNASNVDVTANYAITAVNDTTGVITKAPLTITADNQSRLYGAANPSLTASYSGFVNSETVAVLTTPAVLNTAATPATSIGGYPITVSGATSTDYNITFTAGTLTISVSPITVTADAKTKVYGNVDPTLTYQITSGALVNADTFSGALSRIAGNNVGVYAINQNTLSLSSNYALTYVGANITITVRPITVTAQTNTKVYNGTTSAAAIPTITSGTLAGGDTANFTEVYNNKNAGTGKTLTPSGVVIDGNSGNNYSYTFVNDTTGVINANPIIVTALANTKVYDSTTSALVIPSFTGTLAAGDTANFIENYGTKTVAAGKLIIPSGIINDGNSGNNYSYTFVNSHNGVITLANLTISGLTASNKVYDSNTNAVVTGTISLVTPFGLDDVSIAGAPVGTFSDRHTGVGKSVAVSGLSLVGTDASNYTLTQPTLTANISSAPLTITAVTNTKVYDQTTSAVAVPTVTGLQGSDTVTGKTEVYSNKNVGTGKTLSVSAYTVNDGNSGNDYTVTPVTNVTGVITQKSLTVSATGINKVYDGTLGATVTLSDNKIAGDTVTDNYTSASFSDKNVGTNKTVSVSGISITGADAPNYNLVNTTATTTANISQLAITVTALTNTKVYDATLSAAAIPTINIALAPGDTANFIEAYTTKNATVSNSKTLVPSGNVNDGNGGANYAVTFVNATNGLITKHPLTITGATNTKVYDATILAASIPTITSGALQGSDTAIFAETYANKNVGSGLTLTPAGLALDGNSGNNYSYTFVVNTTGVITQKALTVSAAGVNKVYDGTTSATVILTDNKISGDTVTDSYTAATFANKNVGTSKTVSVTGISISGADAANYSFNTTASTTANITTRAITVTAGTNTKVYDGIAGAAAIPTITSGTLAAGDTANFIEAYNNKNFGNSKTLTPSGAATDGNSGLNYSYTFVNDSTGVISQKALTVSATGVNKVYDGATTATVTLSDNKVAGDNVTESYVSASFGDRNTGIAKAVSVSGISISGTDSSNYTFNTTASTTANITAAPLTIIAVTNTKTFDNTTAASNLPTVSGIISTDTVTGLTETYDTSAVGNGKTLSVATYTVNDGNGGLNYIVSTPTDTTGVILVRNPNGGGGGGSNISTLPQVLGASTGPVPGCGNRTTGFSITTGQSCSSNTGDGGQVLGAGKFIFTLTLKLGFKGTEVMELQKFLNAAGYNCGIADGSFGGKTKACVIKFQLANVLKGDGVVGALTRALLNK